MQSEYVRSFEKGRRPAVCLEVRSVGERHGSGTPRVEPHPAVCPEELGAATRQEGQRHGTEAIAVEVDDVHDFIVTQESVIISKDRMNGKGKR